MRVIAVIGREHPPRRHGDTEKPERTQDDKIARCAARSRQSNRAFYLGVNLRKWAHPLPVNPEKYRLSGFNPGVDFLPSAV